MRRWWPPIAWAALILTVSSTPGSDLPSTGLNDKLAHAGAYFVLALLAARAPIQPPRTREALLLALALTVFAAIDEWHQRFIPGRFPDVADWVADTVGVLIGVAGVSYARIALSRHLARDAA